LTSVAIALGSNQGDSRELLRTALSSLTEILGGLTVAPVYQTSPVSGILQPDFFNTAAIGSTELLPEDLLAVLKACEKLHGRRRSTRWGPRPLDIDLLAYGDLVSERAELWLPHPRLRERRFYLEPLAEIAPDLEIPPDGTTVSELLAALPAGEKIVRVPWGG
jgi:2-amino-4-hydroxy-6-hydroxymethyldihydropteridine diphosphokinase